MDLLEMSVMVIHIEWMYDGCNGCMMGVMDVCRHTMDV